MLIKTFRKRTYNEQLHEQSISLSSRGKRRVARCWGRYEISSSTRFSDRLFNQAQDIGMQVIRHPFHAEVVEGTLSQRKFERFVVQDMLYLEGCIKSFEIAQVRFPNQWDLFELLIIGTKVGLNQLKELRARFAINKNFDEMNRACEAYIRFLTGAAEKGELAEIIGALWPCYSVFFEMYHADIQGMKLLTCEHPYYEFVKYYKELRFSPSVEGMKQVMEAILVKASEGERARLKKIYFRYFYSSLEHERQFFDAVYEADRKVVNIPRVINSIISIKERLLEMPRRSWVFWDLDDTIWLPDLILLRTANNELLEKYILNLESKYPNIRELIWELYYHCDYRLVEDDIVELFSDLKNVEINVLGLTKREAGHSTLAELKGGLARQDLTLRQLNKLGVSFSSTFPGGEILLKQKVGTSPAILKDGVTFTSGLDKGPILRELLDKAKELGVDLPPQIAFFDNLYDNVCNVEEKLKEAEEYRIPVIAVHYRGAANLSDDDPIDYEAFNRQIRDLELVVRSSFEISIVN